MLSERRSGCPINLAVEILGDHWSLLIVRDLMFAGKRHFREFLRSEEQISTNILANRLSHLVEVGVLTKSPDAAHRQRVVYSLTPMGIDLLNVVTQLGKWGNTHLQPSGDAAARVPVDAAAVRRLRTKLCREHVA